MTTEIKICPQCYRLYKENQVQTIPRKTGMPKVQYRTGITRSICTKARQVP